MSNFQNDSSKNFSLTVTETTNKCAVGEKVANQCMSNGSIPVLSCEGGCIRGEIARLVANNISKQGNFKRGCHGELFAVPDSKISKWIKTAEKVICIDGCYLKCHSRIMEHLIEPSRLLVFDALSHYKKYNDLFNIDDVPEDERKEVAQNVTEWVLKSIEENNIPCSSECSSCS
jgi:uncharacterized metal-binding protein